MEVFADNEVVTLDRNQRRFETKMSQELYDLLEAWKDSRETRISWTAVFEFLIRMLLNLPEWMQKVIVAGRAGAVMQILGSLFPDSLHEEGRGKPNDRPKDAAIDTDLMYRLNEWRKSRVVRMTNRDIGRVATRIFVCLPPNLQEEVAFENDEKALARTLAGAFPEPDSARAATDLVRKAAPESRGRLSRRKRGRREQ